MKDEILLDWAGNGTGLLQQSSATMSDIFIYRGEQLDTILSLECSGSHTFGCFQIVIISLLGLDATWHEEG